MNKNNKFPIIKYFFSSLMVLTFIICLVLLICNINDLTSFSYLDIRNIIFYFIVSFFYNLISLFILAMLILPLYSKYNISLLFMITIALPFFVVITPHILVWIGYTPIDDKMSFFGKILFNLSINIIFMFLLIFFIKLTKFVRLISNKTKMIGQILKISSATYLALLFFFFITLIASEHGYSRNKSSSPNIVLIVVDALRKDFIGAYGFPLDITPCIDRLAKSGILFENAFTGYPASVPGHASILFGEDIEEHKAMSNEYIISERKESIARILKERGYFTFGVCHNGLISRRSGFGQGFDFYWSWGKKFVSNAPIIHYFSILPINQIIIKALEIDLINTYSKMLLKRDSQPFFCFIQYIYCHSPYKDYSKPRWVTKERRENILDVFKSGKLPNETSWSLEKVTKITSTYAASIYYVDSLIRNLIQDLSKKDLIKNTLVIVTADHGENLAEHGEKFAQKHGGYYNTSLEIPMIIWSPNLSFKDVKLSGITSQAKIKASVLDAISQESILFSNKPNISALRKLMCKNEHFALGGNTFLKLAILTNFLLYNNSFKYVINTPDQEDLKKLYRWREDFFDRNNIYNDNISIADIMHKRLLAIISENDIIKTIKNKRKLTREQIRNLKSLGYIK